MKRFLLIMFLISSILFSCRKNVTSTGKPEAKFSIGIVGEGSLTFGGYGDSSFFIMGTHDTYNLINQSTNADSVLWDFGNGKTSNSLNPIFPSDSAGNFQVTLTAFNKNGSKSTASKKITVLERVLKSISINNLGLNNFTPNQAALPIFSKVDLWFEIKYSQKADPIASNGEILAPVIFKSPVFTDVDSSFHSSLTYTLPETDKVIINCPVNGFYIYPDTGRGTIVSLYAKDNSGTYLIATNGWGGLQFFEGNTNPLFSKNYTIGFNVPLSTNAIRLNLAYEF